MKKLFVPFLLDSTTSIQQENFLTLLPGMEPLRGYHTFEAAEQAAKQLALRNPKGRVVILESTSLIEPRHIEFAHKKWNSSGELIA